MKLHLNPPYFRAVLNGMEKRTGKRRDILEKDYYITLILEELSQQGGNRCMLISRAEPLYTRPLSPFGASPRT